MLLEKVNKLETDNALNKRNTDMVFNMLKEIKDSIKSISDKLNFLEKRPGQHWDDLIKIVITVIATAAITYLISK
jgi:uncharacterized protein YoxC